MKFIITKIEDVFIIEPEKKGDGNGWFMRTFDLDLFKKNIPSFDCNLVQINQSYNKSKYTWRGFHYQMHPFS
jgi:dTDP-4-dehydrorhamnose 3,5-epimerase-like enzyme